MKTTILAALCLCAIPAAAAAQNTATASLTVSMVVRPQVQPQVSAPVAIPGTDRHGVTIRNQDAVVTSDRGTVRHRADGTVDVELAKSGVTTVTLAY